MAETLHFTKMHGAGNDYIYFNCMEKELSDPAGVAIALSPRHHAVGADGIVMICKSDVADAKMRMFNADGSEGKMCGNAIRCVARYLSERIGGFYDRMTIETLSGIKHLTINRAGIGEFDSVSVEMGRAILEGHNIPVAAEGLIREAAKRFPEMTIGAGTVLNTTDLHRAADAGARFAVAPGFNPTVVREALKCGIDFIPGVLTPGEIEQALELGLRLLKFFPAEAAGGVTMLKALFAPYKHLGVSFMPTGGVKIANVEDYLATPGVAAVGGTWLNNADADTVREAARIAAKYSTQA